MNRLLAMLLFVGLVACKTSKNTKETIQQNDTLKAENFRGEGRWQWVSSSFITRGIKEPKVSTPETLGYTIVLEFKANVITIIKNGAEAAQVPYSILEKDLAITFLQVQIPQDDFPFYIASGPIYLIGDELKISGGYNDAGENQTYKRIK